MALKPVTLPFRFAGGLETKLDEKVVPIGKLLELPNAVFTRGGTPAKRYGYTELGKAILGSTSELEGGVAMGVRGKELCYFTEKEVYSYQADSDAWKLVADAQSVVTEHRVVANRSTAQTLADYAELDGVAVYAWEDSAGGVWAAVLDAETDAVLSAPRQLSATGERPRVHAVGSFLHVYYAEATDGDVMVLRVSPTAPQDAATATVATLLENALNATYPSFDVDDDGDKGVIAWVKPGGKVGLGYIHESGEIGRPLNGLTSPTEITDDATVVAVAIDKLGAGQIALGLMDASTVVLKRYDTSLSLVSTTTVAGSTSDPNCLTVCYALDVDPLDSVTRVVYVAYDESAAETQNYVTYWYRVDSAGATSLKIQRAAALGSKAFADDDEVFAWLVHDSTLYTTYLLQRTDGLIVSRALPGLAGGIAARAHLPSVKGDSRIHVFAGIYVEALESDAGGVFTEPGIRRISADFDNDESHQVTQLGRGLYIGGGLLQVYDGSAVHSADFHCAPDDIADPTQSGSSGLANGTYRYFYTYEKVLANGEVLISDIGAGTSVTVSGGPRVVSHEIPTYRFGDEYIRIGVWRSTNGDTSIIRRVSSLDPTATGSNGYVANDPTVDTVTFDDEMEDEDLLTKDSLYTVGGVLANSPSVSRAVLSAGKGRLLFTSPADPDVLHFSHELRDGYGVEMTPFLRAKFPPYGGKITAALEMDGWIATFKETAIYKIGGPGPFANPSAGGGFSTPELVTSDGGCVNAASIAYTPVGIIYQSKKGIELLRRDWQVQYVGAQVEKFTDPTRLGQTVIATTLIEDRREIRLLMSSGDSLVYNYFFDAWSHWSNHYGNDAVMVDGGYYYLRADGSVWKEDTGSYRDVNSQIVYGYKTPPMPLAEILSGFHRYYYLSVTGNYRSAHTVRIRAYYDYEEFYDPEDEWVIDPSDFINLPGYGEGLYGAGYYGQGGGGRPSGRYSFDVHLARQAATVQFTFEFLDAADTYGAAGEVTEFVVTGGALGPRAPLVNERRV